MTLSIIMPALDEEKNIESAIQHTLDAIGALKIDGEIVFVNDGSSDKTGDIVQKLKDTIGDKLQIVTHQNPEGVGRSFWDGVAKARGEIIAMFPGDDENEPYEILQYLPLLLQVDLVVPFIYNPKVRSFFRRTLSRIYCIIINLSFGVNFNYTNGTVLYRKTVLETVEDKNDSFFYQADTLIKAVRAGYLFCEVPTRLSTRSSGTSKAVSVSSFFKVLRGYFRLIKNIHIDKKIGIIHDSTATKRRLAGGL